MTQDSLTELIDAYARLLVRVGVDLQEGQLLQVDATVEHAPLVRALAKAGYEAGASYVDVSYDDQYVSRALIESGSEKALGFTPPWLVERARQLGREQAAAIHLTGKPDPDLFRDLDGSRVGRAYPQAWFEEWIKQIGERTVSWTIAGCPTPGWAEKVFGTADVPRLWQAIAATVRLDEDDPVAAWQEHGRRLQERASELSERRFDALRYRGPGTDLTLGLLPGSIWTGGPKQTVWGQTHFANMPTEEVFTSPDRNRADGRVRSTRPLALMGTVVRDLELEFKGGRIVAVHASSGVDVVRTEVAQDEHSNQLGEVALVDGSSRVGRSGLTFLNTLFDENATCHIAYGKGFPYCVQGAEELDAQGQLELGLNVSTVHTDLMIGDDDVEVDGLDSTGTATPLLRDGVWQLS